MLIGFFSNFLARCSLSDHRFSARTSRLTTSFLNWLHYPLRAVAFAAILSLSVFFYGCGVAPKSPTPVRVVAHGETFDAAKSQALRKAVENRVGAIVLSERLVVDDSLVETITNYSSGFVDGYKVIKTEKKGSDWLVTLDVFVQDSKVAKGLLSVPSKSAALDGGRLKESVDQRDKERIQAINLLKKMLDVWPVAGIETSQISGYKVEYTADREAMLVVPSIRIAWSEQYKDGLKEILGQVAGSVFLAEYHAAVQWDWNVYAIRDSELMRTLSDTFNQRVFLRFDIKGGGQVLDFYCYPLKDIRLSKISTRNRGSVSDIALYGAKSSAVTTYSMPRVNQVLSGLRVPLKRIHLQKVTEVGLEVTKSEECLKRR